MVKRILEEPDIYTSFPTPLALVTCADEAGKANIMTLAWVGVVCTKPPMVSIATRPATHSHHIIKAGGEFVLNVPNETLLKAVDYCGTVSGKNVDKWENLGLTGAPASRVRAPLITQSPINLECVVRHILHLGSHDAFIAEVLAIHVDEGLLSNDSKLDTSRLRPLVWLSRQYWALATEKLADTGKVGREKGVAT